jgi:hypothetical protein
VRFGIALDPLAMSFNYGMTHFRSGFDYYEAFLGELNIKPNTAGETAVTKAILAAKLLSFERMDAMKPCDSQWKMYVCIYGASEEKARIDLETWWIENGETAG